MSYMSLKSGTDVRGIATDKGGKAVDLSLTAVNDITLAFVCFLVDKLSKPANELTVAVGRDSRITGPNIAETVIAALVKSGVKVYNCGLASTPSMFMTTVELGCDAAVQITASHHPFDRNGLKYFTKEGGLEGSDITKILELADNGEEYIAESKGSVTEIDFMKDYAKILRDMICAAVGKTEEQKPLAGYKIVVDAGNGAGGFYATEVLSKLGADISGSLYLEPDGMFPNHTPNPEDKVAMASICGAVKENNADLGLIFDTDVDRAGCVGKDGNEINRNRLIALAAGISAKEGDTIVTDSVTSKHLTDFLESLGLKHYRYRRGYKNVINKGLELCSQGINCPLAIETSGHAALKENYFLDDGAYLVTKIVIEMAKGTDIDAFLAPLKMPAEEKECRLSIKCADFKAYGQRVIEELENLCKNDNSFTVADDNREGIRVFYKDGWFLLRLSVHDPVMPMNFESDSIGGVAEMIEILKPFFRQFTELDITALN